MKKLVKAVGLVLLLYAIGNADTDEYIPWDQGGPPTPVEPFMPEFEVVSYDKAGGHLTLKFTITYFPDAQIQPTCDLLMMTVYPSEGLTYDGPDTLMVPYKTENPFSTTFELNIPPNDTSYLAFRQECDRSARHYSQVFASLGDSLAIRWGIASHLAMEWSLRHQLPSQEDYERAKREWEEKQEQLRRFKGKGTLRSLIQFSPEDSVFYSTLSDRGKQNFRRMRFLERTPLTDQDRQLHTVDGQWYERLRGETRFRPIPGITKEELRSGNWRRRDSVAANPPDNSYDIVLDLRNHADYEFVEPRVDSLIATSDSGFYETVVDRSTLIELIKHGIQYRRTDGPLMNPRDSTGSHGPRRTDPDRKSESRLPGREGRDEIFSTDFEGAWPGPWSCGDWSATGGYVYWGKRQNWYYYSDSSAAWCAKVGMPDTADHYANHMDAWMETTAPIDLTGYGAVYLDFQLLYDTENEYDWLDIFCATPGNDYQHLRSYTGYNGGFDWEVIPLPAGDDLYIEFFFDSDPSICYDGGVYIDDVYISGFEVFPNLTWDWPPGWDWPIVPSMDSGSNTVSTLYGGEPTFIDWSMENDGEEDSGPFHVGLYLDNVLIHEWSYGTLWWGYSYDFEDYQTTISTGNHTLKLWVDSRNEVQESNENDNTYERTFYWEQSEITYSGHVNFWDMNPPAIPKPARNVTIKMWDKDGSGAELLDETVTDDYGYFYFFPVPNDNDTQDKDRGIQQDIFFSVYSMNAAARVMNQPGVVYYQKTPTVYNHPSGVYDTTIQISTSESGAFHVADAILQGFDMCAQYAMFMDTIRVYLDAAYSITRYLTGPVRIQVSAQTTGWHPETWDRDVLLHEYGHRVADVFDFFDSSPGGAHAWDEIYSLELAGAEGWAWYYAAWVTGDPLMKDNNDGFTDAYTWNCENGEWAYGGIVRGSANAMGKYNEGAVAGILWDIYDYDANLEDYSGLGDYGLTRLPHTPDNIGDTLSMGHERILAVLLDNEHLGHRPDNIDEFWAVWFGPRWNRRAQAMRDIWYEHGDSTKGTCCVGIRGNVDGDPKERVDIADLVMLVDYMSSGGEAPPCWAEANIDGSCCGPDGVPDTQDDLDIADLVVLVDYMFTGGPEPWPCP